MSSHAGWATPEMAEKFAKLARFVEETIGGCLVGWDIPHCKQTGGNCFTFAVKRFVDTQCPYAELSFFPCSRYHGSLGVYGESSGGIDRLMNSIRISLYIAMPTRAMLGNKLDTLIEMVSKEVGSEPQPPEDPSPWDTHLVWKIYEGGKRS